MAFVLRLSSLLLLIGVGSYVCYKLIIEKNKKKRRKRFASRFESLIDLKVSENDELFEEKHNILTSTPFINFCKSVEYSPSISSSGSSELAFNLTDFTEGNDTSLLMPSLQSIGNNTVAKLDQLLDQIQDIKKSVVEIDEQIFDVKESNVKFDSKLFSLVPEMTSSINTESDLSERYHYFNTEPQTPSLEWDSTDLNAQNHYSSLENGLISSFTSSYLKHESLPSHNLEKINNNLFNELESPIDLSSPSISTSGEFSITSTSEQTNTDNALALQKMIEEAKKLGLLNDLIDVLTKKSKFKRDSAYFED